MKPILSKNHDVPKHDDTQVNVRFPDAINTELVQANELRHYELFQWLVAIMSTIAAGFWTAYASEPSRPTSLLWSAIAFSSVTVLFILLAIYYRKKVYHGSITRSIHLKNLQ